MATTRDVLSMGTMKESECERRKLGSWRPRDNEVDERDYFVDVSAMIQGYVAGPKGLAGKDSSASSVSPQFRLILIAGDSRISTNRKMVEKATMESKTKANM